MRLALSLLIAFSLLATVPTEQTNTKTMKIYVIDVEGGNATLIVSPAGQSLLIDTGNLNAAARDAGRILEAIRDAGLRQIDYLVTTHWHLDHFGGLANLAAQIPIREFIDHGANIQPNPKADAFVEQTYPKLYAAAKHTVVKPGDGIPIDGLDVQVVASAGQTIHTPLPTSGEPNPFCANYKPPDADRTENGQSIGMRIMFGHFRALHLGDLSSDKEFDLMCPNNRIGTVDLFIVSHHGQPNSNTPILVDAIESRVAIMNNGTRKGGEPEVMKVIHAAPGLEDLWQLHFSQLSGQEYTVPGMFIANHTDKPQHFLPVRPMTKGKGTNVPSAVLVHNGTAHWIQVSAFQDGSFTVTNSRNDFSKTYRPYQSFQR